MKRDTTRWPVAVLALMMFVVPAVGVPSELMLQDTLKSALVAFGVLIAALVFFWQQRNRTAPLLWHGLVWLPLALTAYALGSMAWSHTYLAGVEAIRWFLLSLLLWLGLNTFTRENLPLLLWGIHGGAVVTSLWAALQFWFDLGLFPQAAMPASTFANRNFFAEYAVSTLPFSVYLLANLRASRWLAPMALSLALNVVTLMMTGTRSALMALLVLVPVVALILIRYRQQFAFRRWSWGQQALVGLVLVAGVLGLGSLPSANLNIIQEKTGTTAMERSFFRAASMIEGKEYTERSFSIRATMWKATARMMIANPWSGVGAGAWEVQIPLYQRVGEGMETDYYAHNEFLQLLSEYGVVVGGLFIAVLFAYLLLAAGKTWRLQGADLAEVPLRSLALASLLALLIVSNAGFPWRLASTGALLAVSVAILAGSDARMGIKEAFLGATLRLRPSLSRAMLVGLACCAAMAVYITEKAVEAEYKIMRAIQLGNAEVKLCLLGKALSAERKFQLLLSVREGIAINPHYRKLSPEVAETLAVCGDFVNAVWIWESVVASRPNVAIIWSFLARSYTSLGQNGNALKAVYQWQRLQGKTPDSNAMEAILLSRAGQESQAIDLLTKSYDQRRYDFSLTQVGYAVGMKTHNWPLAIRSLDLQAQTWPERAPDAYFRMAMIYLDPEVQDVAKALSAFRAGLLAAPPEEKDRFRSEIPSSLRSKI